MREPNPEQQRWIACARHHQPSPADALEEQHIKERAAALGVPYVPRERRWSRTDSGDVLNLAAFNDHMDHVGEEDQTLPGWDQGA